MIASDIIQVTGRHEKSPVGVLGVLDSICVMPVNRSCKAFEIICWDAEKAIIWVLQFELQRFVVLTARSHNGRSPRLLPQRFVRATTNCSTTPSTTTAC